MKLKLRMNYRLAALNGGMSIFAAVAHMFIAVMLVLLGRHDLAFIFFCFSLICVAIAALIFWLGMEDMKLLLEKSKKREFINI